MSGEESNPKTISQEAVNSALELMSETTPVSVYADFVKHFEQFDKDGNGLLSDDELKRALDRQDIRPKDGKPVDLRELEKALKQKILEIDSNDKNPDNGLISLMKSIGEVFEVYKDFVELDPKSLPPVVKGPGKDA